MRFPSAVIPRRGLVIAFACCLVSGATLASAQTVIVRHAMPGATVELLLNATPVGTAKADAEGTATVTATGDVTLPIDANAFVDDCAGTQRVILARVGTQPVAEIGCRRNQIPGLYLVQKITSIVIDVRNTPSLRVRQGQAPAEWLRDPRPSASRSQSSDSDSDSDSASAPAEPLPPLTGLAVFGSVGRGLAGDFESQACGNVSSCSDNNSTPFSGGVAYWFTDYVGAEGRYSYLGDHEASGTGDAYRFTTTREAEVLSFTARGGVRAGRVRPFGRAGMSLHRATLTTNQTINDKTVEIGGVSQTIPGGTQILQMRTKGWAPVFGGGAEVWVSRKVGIFGELQRIGLKGSDDRGADLEIDDAEITVQGGVTVRFR